MANDLYLLHVSLTDILIGIIFVLLVLIVLMYLINNYKNKIKKDFRETGFSSLRILENFEGIAFNCLIDDDWTMKYVSSNAYKLIGYTNEELVDNSLISYNEIIHPKHRKYVKDKYSEAIESHSDVNIEYKIITKSGEERWVAEEASIVYDHFEQAKYVDGFIYDIDFKKELLNEKNQYELRYRSLMDGLDFPIIVIKENIIKEINPSAISFFRANSKNEIVGHSVFEFMDKQYHDFYKKRMKRLKETKTSNLQTHYKLKRLDGSEVNATVDAKPYIENGILHTNVVLFEKEDKLSFNQLLRKSERRNRDLILYMHEGIGIFQMIPDENDGKLIFANRRFSEFIIGYEDNLIYRRFTQIFDKMTQDDLNMIFSYKDNQPIIKDVVDTDKNKFYQMMFYFNKEYELVVQITDKTREKLLIKKIHDEKEILDEILEATATKIWEWNVENYYIDFADKTYQMLGYDKATSDFSDPRKIMKYFHPEDKEQVNQEIQDYFKNPKPYFSIEVRIRNHQGKYRWWMIRGKTSKVKDGSPSLISGTYQDVTEHKEKEEEIKFLSLHDELTKLYNLRAYTNHMNIIDNNHNLPISFAVIDVNGLKVFNDALNHSVGDELLVKTAKILNDFIHEDDILARIGGDEFVMIMPKTNMKDAIERFHTIDKALEQEYVSNIPISISYGIEEKYNDRFSLYQIKDMADSKMYQQKFSGKDTRLRILEKIRNNFFKENPFEKQVVEYVHKLSLAYGKNEELNREMMERIDIASQYYNIGIFTISHDAFNDQRVFRDNKELEYKRHVENGYRIMLATYRNEEIAKVVLYHHEKYNGLGYPVGIKGEDIPLPARIISVVATYARKKLLEQSNKDIIDYLISEKGGSFDPEVVDKFIDMIKK
ncbi:PAS domain-containing protein [Mycoplasmatota bacterium]|nr:PAS domain-containing protein [Mycoplasmatota bacterium]